ncbi:M20 family metallopeptidase [Haladaptatus pallidirubidus]|uniref:Probable succinyl-diaminopimelate desuccinylase n=1 Tax=Haladaptatus pallidirubidus TaxID=1008152 RepID=A0AAV3UQY5_9EURY|nr:M20 family metallopeptidase [Haladaptatus pallidirubidus]
MNEKIIELTSDLIRQESENPPGNEHGVGDYLKTRLQSSPVPFDIEFYEVAPRRPNVVARVGNPTNGSVLLAGHTDVVPAHAADWSANPYEPIVRDGRLVGRGAADMKGALAAKILATEAYYETTDDPGQVIIAFVVDEETNGAGMQTLVNRGIDADAAIIGEPTNLQICTAQKGVARYNLTVRGESGHSGRPDDAINAITGLNHVLDRIETLDDRLRGEEHHPSLAPETITVTEIEGGIAPNVVPDMATATVDWRFHPGKTDPNRFDHRLQELLDGVIFDNKPVSVQVDRTVFARAAEISPDHPLVDALRRAAQTDGVSADAVGFNAATDARFLIHDAGIPTVLFGPGSIEHDAHTVDESVQIADLTATAETYRGALTQLLS